jgi:putative FmdB family regulatory protein
MFYKFRCQKCNKLHQVDIKMADYDKEKNNQICPACNGKLERVIEWEGVASHLGGYSDVGGMATWQTGSVAKSKK